MSETHHKPLDVLFVDDEHRVLDGLRRQFRAKRDVWNMRFTLSGAEAIEMLNDAPADVVVTDMRMPGMSGAQLLNKVLKLWPQTVRFVLSGQTDQTELLGEIGSIHQFLQKPCDIHELEHAIARVCTLAEQLESGDLRQIVAGIHSLPIVSRTYTRLVEALKDESSNADRVAVIVEEDVGLSAKILQLVNSAFFGIPRKTVSVKDAIVLIGTQNLLQIVLSAQIFDTLGHDSDEECVVSRIWSDSSDIGASARNMAAQGGLSREDADTARLAGVLSHIGRAILAQTMPNQFRRIVVQADENRTSLRDAEIDVLGIPQESIGAYALGIWGFGDHVVEAVMRQSSPSSGRTTRREDPLFWLHAARCGHGRSEYVDHLAFDHEWAQSVGFTDQEINQYRSAA